MIKHTFWNFIMPLANLVLEMGFRGVRVDKVQLEELRKEFLEDQGTLGKKYRRVVAPLFKIPEQWRALLAEQKADPARKARTIRSERNKLRKKFKSLLNPNSATAQKELLFKVLKLPIKTNRKTGNATVDEEAIEKLAKLKVVKQTSDVSELLQIILAIREVSKKISTYCLKEE